MAKKKVAVIGAGLGGLSAAARLASYGFDVTLFEKNSLPGGKANQLKKDGFRFDTGPSLLTMPFVLEQLFTELGENVSDYLQLIKLETICKYFWDDEVSISAFSNKDNFGEEISAKTIDEPSKLFNYLNYTSTIYNLTADLFLYNNFSDWKSLFNKKGLNTLLQIWKIDPFRTVHKANSSFFKDKKLIQLFDRYATYNGSNPYKAPATLNIIPHVEYNLGGYVPAKGIYALVEAVYSLANKKGVNFIFNAEVKQILLDHGNSHGIKYTLENKELYNEFDVVISNVDVHYTNTKLLSEKNIVPQINKNEPSTSAIVFYWGINENSSNLDIHNILFSSNYEKEFVELFDQKICPTEPTIYIYISSKYNNADAPAGNENWFVMINAPANKKLNWEKEAVKMKAIIVERIKKILGIDLMKRIISESILTPLDIEIKTSSYLGSLYGISSNNKAAAFLRQKNKSEKIPGLYYCGGSAHPGGGIPLVLLSGKITAELIIKKESNDKSQS